MSVALNDRKRLVFQAFWKISARFGGTVSAVEATQSRPPLPMIAEFSIVLLLELAFMALPSSNVLILRHFRRRAPPARVLQLAETDAHSALHIESGGAVLTL
ncbi:hypothetical protein [Rhizobium leguminosarum]|uniref:hypothetical protein n=1 Tax=Rhizobium leguminosarum TaxID=384 RepID=UPI00143F88D6|nr:hypothetical protein [Rhizobium leguminosarum]NKL23597.1 hypothetical protein [Rhizobium leguminosarum bv. viciae]NKL59939.1 hypothetical protein [Rhizobium leguminosarum bv. viciae]